MTAESHNMTDYEQERKSFRLDVPEHFNFAADVVDRWAEDANRVGMVWAGTEDRSRTLTFRDFAWASNRAAHVFREHGIGKGDRVLVVASRLPEWWEALLGLMKVGAVAAPGTTQLTARDMKYRLDLCKAQPNLTRSPLAARNLTRATVDPIEWARPQAAPIHVQVNSDYVNAEDRT